MKLEFIDEYLEYLNNNCLLSKIRINITSYDILPNKIDDKFITIVIYSYSLHDTVGVIIRTNLFIKDYNIFLRNKKINKLLNVTIK